MSEETLMNVRILAHWIDDPETSPITLDARLDIATKRLAGRWTLFGATSLGKRRCRPFALDARGVMDFGEGRGDGDRYWRTDLREREIFARATFKIIWAGGDEGIYKIDKVARLGSKG